MIMQLSTKSHSTRRGVYGANGRQRMVSGSGALGSIYAVHTCVCHPAHLTQLSSRSRCVHRRTVRRTEPRAEYKTYHPPACHGIASRLAPYPWLYSIHSHICAARDAKVAPTSQSPTSGPTGSGARPKPDSQRTSSCASLAPRGSSNPTARSGSRIYARWRFVS